MGEQPNHDPPVPSDKWAQAVQLLKGLPKWFSTVVLVVVLVWVLMLLYKFRDHPEQIPRILRGEPAESGTQHENEVIFVNGQSCPTGWEVFPEAVRHFIVGHGIGEARTQKGLALGDDGEVYITKVIRHKHMLSIPDLLGKITMSPPQTVKSEGGKRLMAPIQEEIGFNNSNDHAKREYHLLAGKKNVGIIDKDESVVVADALASHFHSLTLKDGKTSTVDTSQDDSKFVDKIDITMPYVTLLPCIHQ